MAKNKTKSKAERAAQLDQVAELYLQGWTQAEIGEHIGRSQQQVSYDLVQLRKRWAASADKKMDVHLAQQLAKLDHLEATYWDAWERSMEERRTRTASRKQGGRDGNVNSSALKTEDVLGDPRYLAGIERCIQQRCKLLGIEAPQKIAPTDPTGTLPYDPGQLSDAERRSRITQLLDAAATGRAAATT